MANSQEIEETLKVIRIAWQKVPELRLCQLLSNSAMIAGWPELDLFYINDDKIRLGLKEFIKGNY